MQRPIVISLVLCAIAGLAQAANLARFNGQTMAAFMIETMITPTDYFEAGGKRIFIADKRAPDPAFGCTLQLVTIANGRGSGADGWTIEQIRYSGGCDHI